MSWQEIYQSKLDSMEDAVSTINSDERVLYSMAVSAPLKMLLNLYSIPGIEEYAVTSLEGALHSTHKIGYPVALKGSSRTLPCAQRVNGLS